MLDDVKLPLRLESRLLKDGLESYISACML